MRRKTLLPLTIFATIVCLYSTGFGQRANVESRLEVFDLRSSRRQVIHRDSSRFEAPNWTRDGEHLIFNQRGLLYKVPVAGGKPEEIKTGFARSNNNDHGISPDGKWLAISHHNGATSTGDNSTIYIIRVEGGEPRQVTANAPSYWHGWSPDGKRLAYVGRRNGEFDIYSIGVEGGEEQRLTATPGLDDGPDYSPDGRHIYYNSTRSGRMQIWRMRVDGSEQKQIIDDRYNDWFPHPSPDGKWIVFLTYLDPVDPGDHPPDKAVMLRLMDTGSGKVKELCRFTGGQGTINVPSWSPDSKRFAFVSYEMPRGK
ncbi:MAG TPA: transporter [Blastocatellia bacterium]|jgi:Tol biopolymer transport system component|nr:transporter [Blastocatellia bacterium]